MNYNERNKHSRDSQIHFEGSSHTYTFKGQIFKSVTTLVGECFEQFDADYWAARKAPVLGMSPDEVKAMWKRKGDEASRLGTQMHDKIERYYLGKDNDIDETYELFLKFTERCQLTPYRSEWAIYDEDSQIAGTLDFLHYEDDTFYIYDWKRSNRLISGGRPIVSSPFRKYALDPISHIEDTTYWHYALQLSIYRYILEKNYDINVEGGKLAIFHPDNSIPYVVEVPYLRDEVVELLSK